MAWHERSEMKNAARAPIWLQVAAVMMVGQSLVIFVVYPITAVRAASPVVIVLLAWLLLRGSRIVWVFVVLSAAAELVSPLVMGQPLWQGGFGVILLGFLLASPSRAYVWSPSQRQAGEAALVPPQTRWRVIARQAHAKLLVLAYGSLAGEAVEDHSDSSLKRGALFGRLAGCVVILFVLAHALDSARHGFGHDSLIVAVLYRVVWVTYSFALFALIVLLVMAAYRYVIKLREKARA
jgi:hypothetical protein